MIALLALVTGCSVAPVATTSKNGSGTSAAPGAAAVSGVVYGGQQAIIGAQVYVLAVSTNGSGQPSTSLMNNVAGDTTKGVNGWYYVPTVANGEFSIKAADYTCTTGQQVYLYSVGGNPQVAGTNVDAALMAVLGKCTAPGTFTGMPAHLVMNEVTTVAAAYALAGFAKDATDISGPNSATAAIANAAAAAGNLVYLGTGLPLTTTPAGNGTVPSAEIITLADILGACVNSGVTSNPPPSGSNCDTLFKNATDNGQSGGTEPTDTASAAINIAHYPGNNVAALWGLTSGLGAGAAFNGGLGAQPNDFTIAVTYSDASLSGGSGVAVDSAGNVWVANHSSSSITELSTQGTFSSYTDANLQSPNGIAIDGSGNIWTTSAGNNKLNTFNPGSHTFTSSSSSGLGGLNTPVGIAAESSGKIWVSNQSGNSLSEFNADGTAVSGSPFANGGLQGPYGIATDGYGNIWAANLAGGSGNSISELSGADGSAVGGSPFTGGGLNQPSQIAIDAGENVWVANQGGALSEFAHAGTPVTSFSGVGGLNQPFAIAVDGANQVWVGNYGGNSISEFNSSGALSPSSGYVAESPNALNHPWAMAVDASGNLWVVNNGTTALTEFVGLASPVAATPLSTQVFNLQITTASLPNGTVGTTYSTQLGAIGGTRPYTWAQTGGTSLSNWGLSLNTSTGAIGGTPSGAASGASLTFTVTDANSFQTSVTLSLTITQNTSVTVTSITPRNAGITIHQTQSVSAATSDGSGIVWSATAGSFSSNTSASGAAVIYTPPATHGVYVITATAASNSGSSRTANVGVTDLGSVSTYHNDNARDGQNLQEYALTPSNVNSGNTPATFGKLFSCTVDSPIYTQPLWVGNVSVGGTPHNVVFVATTNDSLYAFDADTAPCTQLWHVNLLDTSHGGNPITPEAPVPSGTTGFLVGNGDGDIQPTTGVIGTPVIDTTSSTLYVVSKSYISGPTFYQRLHAIDITTGSEKFSGPASITSSLTYPCTKNCTTVAFDPGQENQRAALALANNTVYVAWGAHEDHTPYYGWIAGFTANDLSQAPTVFNDAPDVSVSTPGSGIWLSGGAPAIDSSGNLYFTTGNGPFDANSGTAPNHDYGDAAIKLSSTLTLQSYFASPTLGPTDGTSDQDMGGGGITIIPNGTNPPILVNGSKDSYLFVLNSSSLGGYSDTAAQEINVGNQVFGTGAYWNSTYYIAPQFKPMEGFSVSSGLLSTTPALKSTDATFSFPGSSPSISAAGSDTSSGILWAQDNSKFCTPSTTSACGPAILYAYRATALGTSLWNSAAGTGLGGISNAAGNAMKFTVPTVANGKVYVSTRGTGNSTSAAGTDDTTVGELDVYGLLP
ncbi:MAG: hypothetical protein ACLGXA_15655 [Acidobacteriota bacterium]